MKLQILFRIYSHDDDDDDGDEKCREFVYAYSEGIIENYETISTHTLMHIIFFLLFLLLLLLLLFSSRTTYHNSQLYQIPIIVEQFFLSV